MPENNSEQKKWRKRKHEKTARNLLAALLLLGLLPVTAFAATVWMVDSVEI
jgi:hypothetical protein